MDRIIGTFWNEPYEQEQFNCTGTRWSCTQMATEALNRADLNLVKRDCAQFSRSRWSRLKVVAGSKDH